LANDYLHPKKEFHWFDKLFGIMASKFFLRTVIRNVPQWRSNDFAPYRNILEPYHRTWDYFTGERSRPPLWDISSGCILWLPSKSKVRPETLKGSGFENENEDAFDRPILCVDVEIKSPTNGIIYFVKMGSFSETGGPAQYIQQVDSRVSQWVHRPWAETILPIVRRDSIHNYKRVLYLGEDSKRTENVRSTEESTVQAGCGIFAIPFTEVRCYNNQSGFDVGYKSGKWRDGVSKINFASILEYSPLPYLLCNLHVHF
jgi:hypothetical protein